MEQATQACLLYFHRVRCPFLYAGEKRYHRTSCLYHATYCFIRHTALPLQPQNVDFSLN